MTKNKWLKPLLGVILIIPPVFLFALWMYASNQAHGYPHDVNLYNSYLPQFMRGRFTVSVVSFLLCAIAFGLNVVSLSKTSGGKWVKFVSWLVVISAAAFGSLYLFSLM